MMKKALIIMACAVALIVMSWWGLSRFSSMMFGEKTERVCSTYVIDSLQIGDRPATVSVEDSTCDDFIVSGEYKVILRYRDHEQLVEKVLLVADNLQSDAKAPQIKALTSHNLLIAGRKESIYERGPAEVAGIQITYDVK
jgi:hypothetical protein